MVKRRACGWLVSSQEARGKLYMMVGVRGALLASAKKDAAFFARRFGTQRAKPQEKPLKYAAIIILVIPRRC
jgi:hypothetical protein